MRFVRRDESSRTLPYSLGANVAFSAAAANDQRAAIGRCGAIVCRARGWAATGDGLACRRGDVMTAIAITSKAIRIKTRSITRALFVA